MNVPAIAKQTFESLKNKVEFLSISQFVVEHLNKISSALERARFVHNVVDDYNKSVFSHPVITKFSPCKIGCSGCCHTQVSVTEDEAELLASHISAGLKIDFQALQKQMQTENDFGEFFKLSYEERRCVFLGANDACQVYKDRPSVCRTNAVLGDAEQCSTKENSNQQEALRLIKTDQADMAIFASFAATASSGTLHSMVGKQLQKNNLFPIAKKPKPSKKSISIDHEL
jgi:Fe-S-cluster containining protein